MGRRELRAWPMESSLARDDAAGKGGNGRVSIVSPMVVGASFPAHTTD